MKKFIYTFVLLSVSLATMAQGYKSARVGLVEDGETYTLSYPTTTIEVELLIEKTVVTPGIYARYAQKYLALRAPLVAQTSYNVIDGTINIINENYTVKTLEPKGTEVKYTELPIDQYSSLVLSPEDAARDAASAIFTIRRQRRDIINGEAGESYFGAGLADAMERLDAMEQEYLELFMGSRTISYSVKQYVYTPQEDASRYIVARFDSKSGVLPASDLSGTPIYIQYTPLELPDTSLLEPHRASQDIVLFRIAAPTQCTLFNDSEEITSTYLPIYEFGQTIKVDLEANSLWYTKSRAKDAAADAKKAK